MADLEISIGLLDEFSKQLPKVEQRAKTFAGRMRQIFDDVTISDALLPSERMANSFGLIKKAGVSSAAAISKAFAEIRAPGIAKQKEDLRQSENAIKRVRGELNKTASSAVALVGGIRNSLGEGFKFQPLTNIIANIKDLKATQFDLAKSFNLPGTTKSIKSIIKESAKLKDVLGKTKNNELFSFSDDSFNNVKKARDVIKSISRIKVFDPLDAFKDLDASQLKSKFGGIKKILSSFELKLTSPEQQDTLNNLQSRLKKIKAFSADGILFSGVDSERAAKISRQLAGFAGMAKHTFGGDNLNKAFLSGNKFKKDFEAFSKSVRRDIPEIAHLIQNAVSIKGLLDPVAKSLKERSKALSKIKGDITSFAPTLKKAFKDISSIEQIQKKFPLIVGQADKSFKKLKSKILNNLSSLSDEEKALLDEISDPKEFISRIRKLVSSTDAQFKKLRDSAGQVAGINLGDSLSISDINSRLKAFSSEFDNNLGGMVDKAKAAGRNINLSFAQLDGQEAIKEIQRVIGVADQFLQTSKDTGGGEFFSFATGASKSLDKIDAMEQRLKNLQGIIKKLPKGFTEGFGVTPDNLLEKLNLLRGSLSAIEENGKGLHNELGRSLDPQAFNIETFINDLAAMESGLLRVNIIANNLSLAEKFKLAASVISGELGQGVSNFGSALKANIISLSQTLNISKGGFKSFAQGVSELKASLEGSRPELLAYRGHLSNLKKSVLSQLPEFKKLADVINSVKDKIAVAAQSTVGQDFAKGFKDLGKVITDTSLRLKTFSQGFTQSFKTAPEEVERLQKRFSFLQKSIEALKNKEFRPGKNGDEQRGQAIDKIKEQSEELSKLAEKLKEVAEEEKKQPTILGRTAAGFEALAKTTRSSIAENNRLIKSKLKLAKKTSGTARQAIFGEVEALRFNNKELIRSADKHERLAKIIGGVLDPAYRAAKFTIFGLAKATVGLLGVLNSLNKATGLSTKLWKGFKSIASKAKQSFGNLANLVGRVRFEIFLLAGAFTVAGKSALGFVITNTAKFETFRLQIQALNKDVVKTAKEFAELRRFAAASPLTTEEVVRTFVRLRVLGVAEARKTTEQLGKVAVLFNRTLDDVAAAFISLEARTLRRLGIIIERQGRTAVIQSGKVRRVVKNDVLEIRKAIKSIFEVRFKNSFDVLKNSLQAQFRVTTSLIQDIAAKLGQLTLRKPLLKAFQTVNKFLEDNRVKFSKFFSLLGTDFGSVFDIIASRIENIKLQIFSLTKAPDGFGKFANGLKEAMAGAGEVLISSFLVVGSIIKNSIIAGAKAASIILQPDFDKIQFAAGLSFKSVIGVSKEQLQAEIKARNTLVDLITQQAKQAADLNASIGKRISLIADLKTAGASASDIKFEQGNLDKDIISLKRLNDLLDSAASAGLSSTVASQRALGQVLLDASKQQLIELDGLGKKAVTGLRRTFSGLKTVAETGQKAITGAFIKPVLKELDALSFKRLEKDLGAAVAALKNIEVDNLDFDFDLVSDRAQTMNKVIQKLKKELEALGNTKEPLTLDQFREASKKAFELDTEIKRLQKTFLQPLTDTGFFKDLKVDQEKVSEQNKILLEQARKSGQDPFVIQFFGTEKLDAFLKSAKNIDIIQEFESLLVNSNRTINSTIGSVTGLDKAFGLAIRNPKNLEFLRKVTLELLKQTDGFKNVKQQTELLNRINRTQGGVVSENLRKAVIESTKLEFSQEKLLRTFNALRKSGGESIVAKGFKDDEGFLKRLNDLTFEARTQFVSFGKEIDSFDLVSGGKLTKAFQNFTRESAFVPGKFKEQFSIFDEINNKIEDIGSRPRPFVEVIDQNKLRANLKDTSGTLKDFLSNTGVDTELGLAVVKQAIETSDIPKSLKGSFDQFVRSLGLDLLSFRANFSKIKAIYNSGLSSFEKGFIKSLDKNNARTIQGAGTLFAKMGKMSAKQVARVSALFNKINAGGKNINQAIKEASELAKSIKLPAQFKKAPKEVASALEKAIEKILTVENVTVNNIRKLGKFLTVAEQGAVRLLTLSFKAANTDEAREAALDSINKILGTSTTAVLEQDSAFIKLGSTLKNIVLKNVKEAQETMDPEKFAELAAQGFKGFDKAGITFKNLGDKVAFIKNQFRDFPTAYAVDFAKFTKDAKSADFSNLRQQFELLKQDDFFFGMQQGFQDMKNQALDFAAAGKEAVNGVASAISNNLTTALFAVAEGTKSTTEAFTDMAKAIVVEIAKMIVKMLIFRAIAAGLGLAFGGVGVVAAPVVGSVASSAAPATGAFTGGSSPFSTVKQFAKGSPRISRPTLGLVGEAGPEAIVPLPDGRRIPVKFTGGGRGLGKQQQQIINVSVSAPISALDGVSVNRVVNANKQAIANAVVSAIGRSAANRNNLRQMVG